jgi:homopolymeric O-antigen transport system ATP-binding protein
VFAIRAEELSKQYRIGQLAGGYDTLRDSITRGLGRVTHRARAESADTMWALRDVSFEVQQGEVLGLIGRNGAGKTTLMRLLGRITEPTSGYADIRGRVGSLLEVGTGFHPELTGRENIFLNAAILGMRRSEVTRRFDEIVEFAEVQKFLDTPVKRYSSGMYVRLAFSVAAHLEPEILLVDEVLAVGDAEFQKRCLGRMESLGQSGRTVIFISHNMALVARLCQRLILLEAGKLVADGATEDVVARYLVSESGTSAVREWPLADAPGNSSVRLRSVRVVDEEGVTSEVVDVRDEVGIEIAFEVLEAGCTFVPWIDLVNDAGLLIFSAMNVDPSWREPREIGSCVTTAWVPRNLLNEGTIVVSASLKTFQVGSRPIRQAEVDAAVSFQVVDRADGPSARGDFSGFVRGSVRPLLRWTTEQRRPLSLGTSQKR